MHVSFTGVLRRNRNLLLDEDLQISQEDDGASNDEASTLARARTLTILGLVDPIAPCGDFAPPVIDGLWGYLLRRPPEEDKGTLLSMPWTEQAYLVQHYCNPL